MPTNMRYEPLNELFSDERELRAAIGNLQCCDRILVSVNQEECLDPREESHERGVADAVMAHVQGVALCRSHDSNQELYFLSSSSQGRYLVCGDLGSRAGAALPDPQRTDGLHFGGIQCVGDVVAVPVYGGGTSGEVRFYHRNNGQLRSFCDSLAIEQEPYSVGITNVAVDGGRYVLAVGICENGNRFRLYVSSSDSLSSGWSQQQELTLPESYAYRNNIALVADNAGTVYFLGMYDGVGDEILKCGRVDLYELGCVDALTDGTKTRDLCEPEKSGCFDFESGNRYTVSFRYGGSARVTDSGLEVVACSRDANWRPGTNGNTRECVVLNRFVGGWVR